MRVVTAIFLGTAIVLLLFGYFLQALAPLIIGLLNHFLTKEQKQFIPQ